MSSLGFTHASTTSVINSIVEILRTQKKLDGLEQFYTELVERMDVLIGPTNPVTLDAVTKLCRVLVEMKKNKEAKIIMETRQAQLHMLHGK